MATSNTEVLVNLALDEERTVQVAWTHTLRISGTDIPDSQPGDESSMPGRTNKFRELMTD